MAPMELDPSERTYAPLDPATAFWLYAFDIGTSGTKAYAILVTEQEPDQEPIIILLDGQSISPAVVAMPKDENDKRHFYWGTDLHDKLKNKEVKHEELLHYIKLCLYSEDQDECPPNASETWDRIKQQKLDLQDILIEYFKALKVAADGYLETHGFMSEAYNPNDLKKLPVHVRLTSPQMLSPGQRAKMQIAAEAAGFEAAEIVAEPVCAVACYADGIEKKLRNMGIASTSAFPFLVVDTGCGTIDIVLFQHDGRIDVKAKFRAISQSTGHRGASQQVNEHIRAQVVADMDSCPDIWKGGVEGQILKAGIERAEFDYRLNRQIERIKTNYPNGDGNDYAINISGKGHTGHNIHYEVTE